MGVRGMRASPAASPAGRGGTGGGGAAAGADSRKRKTSLRVTRPPKPVPAIRLTSRLCSRASRRTAGERRLGPFPADGGGGGAAADTGGGAAGMAVGAGSTRAAASAAAWASTAEPPVGPTGRASATRYDAGVGGAAVAGDCSGGVAGRSPPPSTSAIGAPIGTVSPSCAMIRRSSPATGDGTSIVTLSVMTSTSGSYRSTRSPGCFSHLPMVPSTTLSPTWGSSMSCGTGQSLFGRARAGGVSRRPNGVFPTRWLRGWAYRRLPGFARKA